MKKTYQIIDVTIKHPKLGDLQKQNIEYYEDGKLMTTEFYPGDTCHIRDGYEPIDSGQPKKECSLIAVLQNATPEELQEVKKLLSL